MSEPHVEKQPPVPPFVQFCCAAVPMVFDDSLSYYETVCALWKYIDGMTKVINNNALITEDFIAKVNELHEYVEHYFDNLDVQEEINNKLDQMALDGTLQEIISTYLQSNVTWTFDTVADMKEATNLTAGSYAKTLGFYELGDGGGATYYITDSGTADEKGVIAVGDLFATIVTSDVINVKQFGAHGDGETNDSDYISAAISYAKTGNTIIFPTATYLCNIYCTKALHFDMQGSKLISANESDILTIRGSKSSTGYLINASVTRGSKDIVIQQTGTIDLAVGDYILLRDDTLRPGDSLANINEEVHQIENITNNVVTLRDFVRFNKSIATLTANVYKLNMLENISIKNAEVYDDNNGSGGITVYYAKDVTIENIKASNMTKPCIALISSVDSLIKDFNFSASHSVNSGEGYGVLIDHGSCSFNISNGKGDKQRHLIDCSSCFDGVIRNVISTNSLHAAFMMSHNSFTSDLTFEECISDGCDWYAFHYANQGVTNYYDSIAYNFNIINCKAYLDNASVNSIGCYFACPAQDCTIENFKVEGKTFNSYGTGIRLQPINNRIYINNTYISRVNRAFLLENTAHAEDDKLFYVRIINTYLQDCNFGFRIGNLKEIFIDKIHTDTCKTLMDIGAYDAEKTNPLRYFNLTNGIFKGLINSFVFNSQTYEDPKYIVGKINNVNLNTSEGNYKVNVVNGGKILGDITSLFFRCSNPEGIFVPIYQSGGNAVTLASDFLVNGFTLYQTVTITNYGSSTITLPHSSTIQNVGGTSFALTAGSSTKYIWNGVNWHQVA